MKEGWLPSLTLKNGVLRKSLDLRTLATSDEGNSISLRTCLPNKAKFISLIFLNPIPPNFLGKHKSFQDLHPIHFLSRIDPLHQKEFNSLPISLQSSIGSKKNAHGKIVNDLNNILDKNLSSHFQLFILPTNFSLMNPKISLLFLPNKAGSPRYFPLASPCLMPKIKHS